MSTYSYNIVIRDSAGKQQQYGVTASTWANAISAAKTQAGLATDSSTDDHLLIAQWTGTIDVMGA